MPDNKKKFSDWEKELYPPKEVKGVGLLEMTEQLKQQPEPESQKIEPPPIEQQKSIEPLQIQPSQTDYDILKQRYKDAQTEMSAFEQHRQRLNAPEPTTPQATKEQLEYKGASLGEYGAYIGEKNVQKEEAKRIEQGIKEQGIEFIKQERLKKQYEEQQKIKALQQNLNPDIDKKIKEYEDKQPAWTEQFSLIHKPAKNEEEQLHYDIQSQLYNNDRLNYDIARNVLRDTKNILNAPIKTEGGGFFEATSNELKQLDTWVTIAGLSDNLQKSSVIKYAQTGKPLTTSESALLDAVFDYYYVSNERAGNISKAYIGGQIAGKSIPFMLDFVMTGGFASGATGGFGKAMAKHIENKLINKFGKEAYKKLTKTGVDRLIKAPGKFGEEVVAGAIQAPMTPTFYTGVIEETMAKPIEKTDKGYVFQQGAPIKDAVIRGMNEVIFERSGEFIGDVFSPLGKALSSVNYFTKIPSTKLKNFNRLFYGGKGTFAETLKATGFNGLSSEMGKEVLGQVANYVTGASTKEELDEFFSKDNFQAMLMGFAPMTGVSVAGNVAQRLIVNNNHKKAVNNINTDFGNQAPDVIAALNETSPDRIQNIVDEIMLNNGGYEGNKITDKGKRMATDMLRYIYTKAQVEAVKGIDQDNYKTIGAPKSAENYLQDGKHTVSLYDEQGEVIVQKQFENEEAAEKYKQKLNEMYMTPNNEFDNKINEGLNNLTQKTVTKLNALKSNQKNANGEDVIVSAIVQGLSSEAIGVPNGTEIYVKADNGKQSIVQYVENGELKKAVIPNENITEKQEELLSDAFTQYMETATKTMYQTAAQTNQVIMEGLAEEENMTTNDFSTKKAGHKIKYDGKEATIQSVDTDNDGNKYADLELEDGSIIKSVPLRNVKNPKTVTFNVGKQRIELSKSNETGYFQSEIYSKEKAETIKNGIQISDDYISEIKEQPNPANPIEKGYRVIIREKTEEEKQSKTEVFDMLKTNIVENGLYIRNKKGFVSIIPADEIEINELTDKGELRFTDKESGIPIIMPLENQQELKAEYEQQQLETQKGTTTEVKPETTTVESKVETEPTYKGLFEQTKQQYGVETAIQDIQDEITLKNQQLEEVNNKLKKASLKEKATLREQLQFINRELTELNNILKSEEYAIKERNVAEDNIQKYQSRDEGGETAEASRSDSVEPSTEKQSENEPQPIVETPVSEDKKVVAPTKPQGVEVPTEKKVGEKAVKQYSELTETERKLIDVSNKRIGGKLDVDNVILIAEKIAKSENKEIDVQHVLEALNYEMSKNDPTYGRLTTDDVNGDIVDGNIRVAMLERMEEVGVLPKDGVAEIKKAKELADRIKKMNLSTNVKSLLKTTIDRFYVLDANQNNNSLGIGVVDNINDLLDRIDKNKDNSYFTDKKGKKTKLTFDQVVSQEIYNKIKEGEPTEDGENPTIKESLQVEEPKLSLSELPKKSYATINFYDGDTRTGEIIKETDKEISIKSDIGRIYTVPKSNIVERYDEKPQPKFAISKQPLSNLSSKQPLSNLSSEERLAAVKTVITQINDGKNVEVVDDMVTYLEKLFKNNPNTLERINNLKNAGGIVTGVTIGDKIIINSNQATINDCVAAFEHERQHVENKNDKTWNDLQNDIARNVDIKTLQKEVSGLSGNAFYEGLNINVLADEYIAHIAQQTFEGKEVKSILKYKNIIQDEYRSRNGNRLAILGRESYTDESTEGNIRQGKFDNVAEEGRFLGSNQVSEEEQQIIFEAKVNDTYLKAPNGKSTNLNEKQWVQVRTKAFKDWFGDWENDPENASKVVDENGEPLVVYHGGGANIIAFDYDKIGMQGRSEGAGFEFTENIELAKNYAKNHGEGLYSVFLNIKNPIKDVNQKTLSRAQKVKLLTKFNEKVNANEAYTSDLGKDVIFSDYTETQNIPKAIIEIVNMLVDDTDLDFINEFINTTHMNKEILEAFKETTGYDGVILDKTNEWAENGLYVAFTNTQIKSATANIGTFDVENEDIRFASSPTEQQRQAINYINEIADSETVKDAEASTNYRKAYIERYEVLKAKLTAKNPNIVETYQDVLKYLEALANDKTWSRWDKSARPQLKSIRDSVKELKKAGSIRGLKNKLDKAVDIVLERQNETARRIIKNFVNQKLEGKKGKGVRIPKLVDDTTRQFFDSIKEWINKDSQSIDNELQKLQNEYETKKAGNEKNRLEAQIKAFTYIQHYKSGIKRREDNISNIIIEINKLSKEYTLKDIRKEISLKYSLIAKNKKRLEKADERTKVDIIEENINLKKEIEDKQKEYKLLKQSITLSKANKGQLETLKTALLNERISMQNSMETFIKQLDMVLREGIKAKRLFAEKEEIKKHAILKDIYLEFAMSEMESVINPAKKESKLAVWRKILLDPIYTFSYMLKSFAIYSPDGRGRLYERFFTNGVMVARQKELNGIEEATKAIDVKIIEIFGEGNHITQVQNICNKFNGASITIKTKVNKLNAEKGEYEVIEQEHIQEINNGQALYIYAIAKMPDGMIKLNAMGIDQEQIDAVTTTLDPKLIEFMDWVQDEYLPVLRAKYNDTHIDLFGTQLDQIDKYFPLNIDRSAIPSEVDIEDKGNFFGLPTTITGSIINRVFNKHAIDIRNSDAIETLINHVQSMEKWNAYAPVIKDLNILNSDNTFKKHIDRYIFHGAANLFKDMCAIAVGSYVPKGSIVEDVITTLTKIYARSKIVLRLNTALKQGLSLVQIIGEADPKFMENAMKNIANPLSFKWALDNLPLFRERWESRTGGDDRLSLTRETTEGAAKKIMDIINKTSNIGMIPNAAVDLYVCGIIAKAMYETKYNFYKKERGYSTEESIDKALKDAEIVYNEAQQSAEDMYLSRTQKDRTFMAASISLFNNASFSYQRLFFEGVTAVLKQIKPKGRERLKATQKAKYIVEGRTPEVAEQYAKNDVNRALAKGIMQIGLNGYLVQFVWNVGSSIGIMKALKYILVLFGDDDRDKEIAIDNFKEDMRNAAIKSLTTPVRGLPGGKELESLTELYLKGWNIRQMNVESNPLITDTKQTFNDLSEGYKNNDWVKIVNAFVRYSSGFTGVDLNTIANVIYGIYDLIENHENLTTSDVLLDLSLIINSPMSEQKFLAVSRRDNDTFEDIVNRYIELKRVHKYGSFTPFTDKEDSKAKQDVAKIINVRYHTLKDMLNEYDKAIETYNKFHTDDYIDLYVNPSYKNASDLKYELEYTAKNDMLNETQLGALKTAIESLEKDESLNEIYKKAKKDAWSTSRQKEPELE